LPNARICGWFEAQRKIQSDNMRLLGFVAIVIR
jgi:hypothetical protein